MRFRKRFSRKVFITILVIVLITSGCSQVVTSQNYTLMNGQQVNGSIFMPSGNADLQTNTRVTGSVLMLCCNLKVDGEVDGSVLMLTGNIAIGPDAKIHHNVRVLYGNIMGYPGINLIAP